MTVKNERWVNDWFRSRVRDRTPVSACNTATVLHAPFSSDPEVSQQCALVLSDRERIRASRFVTEEEGRQFIQRRAFRRYCAILADGSQNDLSQADFRETDKGRPYLPGRTDIWFSFASCPAGCLAAWSSTHSVGTDIEDLTQNIEASELARSFYSEAEATEVSGLKGVERSEAFLRYWSLKEAALKSIGEGLPFGLDAFEFELDPKVNVVKAPGDASQFAAYTVSVPESVAALIVRKIGGKSSSVAFQVGSMR